MCYPYKHAIVSLFLHFFHPQNFHFIFTLYFTFVSLYKGRLEFLPEPTWETFSAYLIVLDNLGEVFVCSIVANVWVF